MMKIPDEIARKLIDYIDDACVLLNIYKGCICDALPPPKLSKKVSAVIVHLSEMQELLNREYFQVDAPGREGKEDEDTV